MGKTKTWPIQGPSPTFNIQDARGRSTSGIRGFFTKEEYARLHGLRWMVTAEIGAPAGIPETVSYLAMLGASVLESKYNGNDQNGNLD